MIVSVIKGGNLCLNVVCLKAELRASVFEAIEEEDKAIVKDEGLPPALLGSCNDRAKQLHASPSGMFNQSFKFLYFYFIRHAYLFVCMGDVI